MTVALAATGRFPWRSTPAYIAAQVAGATVGALAIVGTLGDKASKLGLGVAAFDKTGVSYGQATFAEAIGTFLLVFTVFGVIDRGAAAGWAGLAIGFMVFAVIIVVAPATSSAINPARTTGLMIIQSLLGESVQWYQYPAYLIGEFVGGVLAALAYVGLNRGVADEPAQAPGLSENSIPADLSSVAALTGGTQ